MYIQYQDKDTFCFVFFIEEAYFCWCARSMQVILYSLWRKVLPFSSCGRPWRVALLQTLSVLHSLSSAMASLIHWTTNQNYLRIRGYYLYTLVRAYKTFFFKLNVGLPVLWKNPVKVSCRFEATLQDKRLELKPLHAFDPFSQVQKNESHINLQWKDILLVRFLIHFWLL